MHGELNRPARALGPGLWPWVAVSAVLFAAQARAQAPAPAAVPLPPLPGEVRVQSQAQVPAAVPLPVEAAFPAATQIPAGPAPGPGPVGVATEGCATCGGAGTLPRPGGIAMACTSCGGTGCIPGRKKNGAFHYHTFVGRFFGNLYECLCCPDPCYEPSWVPEANAAFFVDYAKPRTVQRIRWDHVTDMSFPDRNEFFWARENIGHGGLGPSASGGRSSPAVPRFRNSKKFRGEPSLDFDQLSYYQEAATDRASLFVEIPYRSTNPLYTVRHAGFADMNAGTKALFFDCELLQLAFQFRTYIPIGNTTSGLGVGHVSLEPSLLGSLRLAPQTYFQSQLSEWIPIGGNTQYQGSILHYHFSLNHVLFRLAPESPVIGTFEMQGWSFQTGAYTDPFAKVPERYSGGGTYFALGPGLRTSICNRIDFGGAMNFPVTDPNMGSFMLRVELRVLY